MLHVYISAVPRICMGVCKDKTTGLDGILSMTTKTKLCLALADV